jgi:hypothetical protein
VNTSVTSIDLRDTDIDASELARVDELLARNKRAAAEERARTQRARTQLCRTGSKSGEKSGGDREARARAA